MGLDMWVRRVSKVYIEDKTYTEEEIRERDLSSYLVSDFEKDEDMFHDLLPYVSKVSIKTKYYDVAKIIEDFNLPKESYINRISGDGITVGGRDKRTKTWKTADITMSTVQEKYIRTVEEPSYVFRSEEVAYWRKAYELQEAFYREIGHVENCGYYILDSDIIGRLKKEFEEEMDGVPREDPEEDEALFYHEWY